MKMTKEQTQEVLNLIEYKIGGLEGQLENHLDWNKGLPKNRQTDLTEEIAELKNKISDWMIIQNNLVEDRNETIDILDSLKTGCKITYGKYSYKGHTEEVFINTDNVFIYTENQRDFDEKYFLYENDDVMNLIGTFRTIKDTKEYVKENNLKLVSCLDN
jgi:hypothetical protein